jgi:hypothetical protein
VIDAVYKEFTTSPQHPTGGSATLTLLNDAEPFDAETGGVRYAFQPPGKTFMEPGGQSGERGTEVGSRCSTWDDACGSLERGHSP